VFEYIKKNLIYHAKKVIYHMSFIDRKIEEKLANYFHQKKSDIVEYFLKIFSNNHPQMNTTVIQGKLEAEANRVCDFTDRAILRANIKKAKYTFWITAIGSTILILAVSGFKTPLSFATPPFSSSLTYVAAIYSITALYNQRVKGAMNSITKIYEAELEKTSSPQSPQLDLAPHLDNTESIVIDFIPSTITIQTSLNNKTTIFLTRQNPTAEQLEQKNSVIGSSHTPTTSTLIPAQTDLCIQWQTWKNTPPHVADEKDISVENSGPTWHF
jgi:hypothetical protein